MRNEHTLQRALSRSIVKALLYSDIFQYPLTAKEVFSRLETNHVSQEDVDLELENLAAQRLVFRDKNFFSIRSDASQIERREKGNALADKMMPKALRRARLIYHFPFVRAVMFSGSLSKNYADANSDVDFFIITATGRLWIARTLLAIYQKTFLFNSKKYFCINYFIDEDHLTIEEQNVFTSVEMATLIPIYNFPLYLKLLKANTWVKIFLPNFQAASQSKAQPTFSGAKQVLEALFSFTVFDKLDGFLMKRTVDRWRHLHRHKFSPGDFEIAFKAKPYVSKGHAHFYQKKTIETFQQRVDEFFSTHRM